MPSPRTTRGSPAGGVETPGGSAGGLGRARSQQTLPLTVAPVRSTNVTETSNGTVASVSPVVEPRLSLMVVFGLVMTFAARLTKNSAVDGVPGGVQELPCGQAKWSYGTPATVQASVSRGKGGGGPGYGFVRLLPSTKTFESSVTPVKLSAHGMVQPSATKIPSSGPLP